MTGNSTNKKGLSIIVPVLNEASVLPRFIDALLVNSFYENQLIFVDGGSDDGGDEYINTQQN
jgi:glycosyltransferase involved in cell wall biosynthesis